jgi:hypothetical protein
MTGGDQERATTRSEIEAEITTLARQQIKATNDATFLGWDPAALIAYEERRLRLAWLHKKLGDINSA